MKKYFILLLISFQASAVFVNHKGKGEVLIVPYYSVNNELNTMVSVTNTKLMPKALKVNIREGLNGYAVKSFNVYIGPNDTWTFSMGITSSEIDGYVGEDNAAFTSFDHTCTSYTQLVEELSPQALADGPQDLQRLREGFIEIIEMGELLEDSYQAALNINGIQNCTYFYEAWQEDGIWHEASGGDVHHDFAPVSGGLMAEADIIHVTSGANYSIPVVAFADFFADDTMAHISADDSSLSLDAAAPYATILTDDKVFQLQFDRGIDAVSSVLMADQLTATFAVDANVEGTAETVLTQPTRRFYINNNAMTSEAPYAADSDVDSCSSENYGGVEVDMNVFDRDSQSDEPVALAGVATPASARPAYCGSVFVQSMRLHPISPGQPEITGSHNYHIIGNVMNGTENGFILSKFLNTRPLMGTDIDTSKTMHVMGLPVIGLSLNRFINNNAQPGVLAQYGFAHRLKSKARVIEQSSD